MSSLEKLINVSKKFSSDFNFYFKEGDFDEDTPETWYLRNYILNYILEYRYMFDDVFNTKSFDRIYHYAKLSGVTPKYDFDKFIFHCVEIFFQNVYYRVATENAEFFNELFFYNILKSCLDEYNEIVVKTIDSILH